MKLTDLHLLAKVLPGRRLCSAQLLSRRGLFLPLLGLDLSLFSAIVFLNRLYRFRAAGYLRAGKPQGCAKSDTSQPPLRPIPARSPPSRAMCGGRRCPRSPLDPHLGPLGPLTVPRGRSQQPPVPAAVPQRPASPPFQPRCVYISFVLHM